MEICEANQNLERKGASVLVLVEEFHSYERTPVFPVYTAFNHTSDTNKPVFTALPLFMVSFINPDGTETVQRGTATTTEECNDVSSSNKSTNKMLIYQPQKLTTKIY